MKRDVTIRFCLSLTVLATLLLAFSSTIFAEDLKPDIQTALDGGDTTQAITLLREEMELDKGYHYNYYILGRIFYNQERYKDAKAQLEIALDKKSKHWESLYLLGLTELKLENLDTAEELMERGRKKAGKEFAHVFENGYGLVKLAKKEYAQADLAFRQALVDADLAEYHINLGDANFYQGIPSLAIVEYEKALAVDTASLEVYYHWAEACMEMRDYKCAIEKLQIVLSKDSTHAPAWNRAGSIYFKAARSARSREDRKARFSEAVGSYRKYFELANVKPDSASVRPYFELAMAYVGLNGFEDAAENFEKVLSIPYEPRDIYFYYGKSLWGAQKYEEAAEKLLKHIEWAEEQDPADYQSTVRDAELYTLLGDSYYYRKPHEFGNAAYYYTKALDANPNNTRVVQNMAVAQHSMRNFGKALTYYDQRIEMGIDEKSASILKNAGSCALNIARNASGGGGEVDLDDLDALEEGDGTDSEGSDEGIDPNLDYYQVAMDYWDEYLALVPDDDKILALAGNTALFTMRECEKGVGYFQKLLEIDPNSCVAKRALGYSYFGGVCTVNYGKALGYLLDAYQCISNAEGACSDVDVILWTAQCYHLRAADKAAAKQDANDDFKNAFEWYGKVLKCEPGHAEAKKGQDDTRFEFVDN